ncbi:tyrosine-protein phosphatase Lar-like isoform X2 [Oppia nitens]|uniref:tyrosine-protein phosphatase Lar-like isoform X2 n=1 Tax=Oppia nitens TaxID=1686743 RepID=UPI0023DBAB2F|nr:tyrosine-protein phosphatase Lar-like isoform X2 [Oppia nitens]
MVVHLRPLLVSLVSLIALTLCVDVLADDPPRIITAPKDQLVVSGRVATFVCAAIGTPKPQIEWRKNGKRLVTQRYTVLEIPNGSVLRIEPVRANRDNSTYECLAENGVGEPVRAQALLNVFSDEDIPKGFPRFTLQPHMQGVERGRNALIPCKAEGDPDPHITWFKDMVPIDMSNTRYSYYSGASLQIVGAEEQDQGQYECVAENKVGTAYSDLATLYVRTRMVPPYFSIPPEKQYEVMPGSSLNLTCVAVGSPMPYVSWKRGQTDIRKEEHEGLPIGKNVLILEDIRESANYTCIAHSKLGNIEALTQVIVQSLPRPPTNVRVSDVTPSSVRLSWSYDIGAENIVYFVIQYKPKNANQELSEISGITTFFYIVGSLTPFTEYEYYVVAVNAIGRGQPSSATYVMTGETMISSHPRNLNARPLSSSTIVVQWDQPEEPNGQVTGYKVYYTAQPSLPTTAWNTQTVDSNQLTTISDLQPHMIYTIRVQAFTSRGSGPLSMPVQVKTQQGVPSQPSNLRATATSATSVQLNWQKPLHVGEAIIGYEVYWNDTFTNREEKRAIPDVETFTLGDLNPDTLYYVWVAAKSRRGEGAATPPIPVKTEQFVPGAPPQQVRGNALDSRAVRLQWQPPPRAKHHGTITYYKIIYFEDNINIAKKHEVNVTANELTVDLKNLNKWTNYRISVVAGTEMGDGPASQPIIVQTDEDVPGEPRDVRATALNSTSILVEWLAPIHKEQNGLIRGYQIHVQEVNGNGDLINDPIRFDVADGMAEEYNITGLQPDTDYAIQVAAVTRKGDGTRSRSTSVRTLGGVPSKPDILIRLLQDEPQMSVEVQWSRPNHTYGQLMKYKLKYGRMDSNNREEMEIESQEQHRIIKDLDRGARYEFRISGSNVIGWGQESVAYVETPEGIPRAPPQNLTYRLQSPTTVVVNWDPPLPQYRNGKISGYGIHFHKLLDQSPNESNTSQTRMVFSSLDENTEYTFRVRTHTSRGAGPWSNRIQLQTPGDVPPAPTNVQSLSTSETSVEVWWDEMPFFNDILGYHVLYSQTPVEDLDLWYRKEVALTWSASITGLEPKTMYAIRVAAYTNQGLGRLSELITVRTDPTDVPLNLQALDVTTHTMTLTWKPPKKLEPTKYKITYGAHKEFYDSQGVLQRLPISPESIYVSSDVTEYRVNILMPFTTYQVNVTAIPSDETFRPPAKITVTTAMAAPKPMVKPDSIESQNKQQITVILPQASEEYGPISHYYLVVVPNTFATKEPDKYTIEELSSTPTDRIGPYIAAKWMRRAIPNTFLLGDGQKFNGFVNRRLHKEILYHIFVRAVVDTPIKSLFTSSPFSDALSLDSIIAEGHARSPNVQQSESQQPSPEKPGDRVPVTRAGDKSGAILILSIVLAILLVVMSVGFCIIRRRRFSISCRRRQLIKSPAADTTMKLLLSTAEPRDLTTHPSDPVELRRLNYQTSAMMSHPPIPVTELSNHIDLLKSNDNMKFSQEYESIEPGQQFTWDNSNIEFNKPKNRYANVIAYDHSRVVLQPLDNIPGSDYINANYCDGYRKQNAYIATQGALPETFGDFWRMVWEQRSAAIVMMTKLEERTRIKCDQYWPSRGTDTYGVMHVTLTNYEELASYCIRTFTLQRTGYVEQREVRQFQFTAWPDHGVPDHPTPFLMFLRRIKTMNPPEAGPLIIHCSAGVGRTGCYIVIDSMLERLKYENTIDIYGHVTCLRAQRNYTVQTEDQYIFIHDAVLEAVIAGNTEVSARNLYNHIQMLMQVVPGENITGMELEFKKIASMKTVANKFISANLPVNKFKNRLMNILPYESTRVFLQPLRGVDGSDYINASFIDGYKYRSAYIATQGPLPETTEDFWRSLWEHNSNIVVILTKLKEMGREKCHQYWPLERSQRYLYYVVDPITEYNMPQYILREFKITDARDGQSRVIRQFHFVEWPEQGVPKSGDGFIEFITQVHKTKEQFGHDGPITVHCSAGVGRTGVFITLSIVLERLQNEGVCDLFQTVRTLRTQRPGMVQTEDQYQFCYRAALEYISSFDNYNN